MAIIPAKKDFEVVRRNDFPIRLTIKDGSGNAVNLTGYSADAEVWSLDASGKRDAKFADWVVSFFNRATGIVDIKLTDTQTATFTPHELAYDFQFSYLKGTLYITEGLSS